MSDQYSFMSNIHGQGHMVAYKIPMKKSNLSDSAVKEFAAILKSNDLPALEKLFQHLSSQQQYGLLKLHIDYNDLENTWDKNSDRGYAIELAENFGHLSIVNYLTKRKKELEASFNLTANNTNAGFFSSFKNTNAARGFAAKRVSNGMFKGSNPMTPADKKQPAKLSKKL